MTVELLIPRIPTEPVFFTVIFPEFSFVTVLSFASIPTDAVPSVVIFPEFSSIDPSTPKIPTDWVFAAVKLEFDALIPFEALKYIPTAPSFTVKANVPLFVIVALFNPEIVVFKLEVTVFPESMFPNPPLDTSNWAESLILLNFPVADVSKLSLIFTVVPLSP